MGAMDENRRPDDYYELIQWRTLGCVVPVLIIVWLLGLVVRTIFWHWLGMDA
jgi:hypothetical protein